MTTPQSPSALAPKLTRINRDLGRLLHTPPADLAVGSDAAMSDELVICGILGGKDVGKSTLINALACTDVSANQQEVGEGTRRPMAYVHKALRDVVTDRLRTINRRVELDVTTHEADPIRNVVLVDLPDFDSEFHDHFEVVRAVAPLLDRVLWVQTPRKIGDRAWVAMFRDVIKDPGNVHCVLNKVDELLSDSEPFGATGKTNGPLAARFWNEQQAWVRDAVAAAGCPQADDHRFLVAAAFPKPDRFAERIAALWDDLEWARYAQDRDAVIEVARLATADLDRLRTCVLGPVSTAQGVRIKSANLDREHAVNVERIYQHYELDRTLDQLAHASDPVYHQRLLNEGFGPACCEAVAANIQGRMRRDSELADELLERRVEHWPLLRLVHWPLGWLSRAVGRRVGATSAERGPSGTGATPFDTIGASLRERIDSIRSHLLADQAVIARQLDIDTELPSTEGLTARASSAAAELPARLEAAILADIRGRDHRPSFVAKAALWGVFLWFPFVQPILSGVLAMFRDAGSWQLAEGLFRIVSALSAPHLLAGFAVVAGIFVALLAAMYTRALRAVRDMRTRLDATSPASQAVDALLIEEVMAPLARPFRERLTRLESVVAQLVSA